MVPQLVIDCGIIDNTPPLYSPFSRSQVDLYMYHGKYYKQGVTASAACLMRDDDNLEGIMMMMMMKCLGDENESEGGETITCQHAALRRLDNS